MFNQLPQTCVTHPSDHLTPLSFYQKFKKTLQDQVPVRRVFSSEKNTLTTRMFFSKMPKTLGKTFTHFSHLKSLSVCLLNQSLIQPRLQQKKDDLDEDYLIYQQIRKAQKQYEKETGEISPSRYPSTP